MLKSLTECQLCANNRIRLSLGHPEIELCKQLHKCEVCWCWVIFYWKHYEHCFFLVCSFMLIHWLEFLIIILVIMLPQLQNEKVSMLKMPLAGLFHYCSCALSKLEGSWIWGSFLKRSLRKNLYANGGLIVSCKFESPRGLWPYVRIYITETVTEWKQHI